MTSLPRFAMRKYLFTTLLAFGLSVPTASAIPPCSGYTSGGCGYAVAYDPVHDVTLVAIACGGGDEGVRRYSGDVTGLACDFLGGA